MEKYDPLKVEKTRKSLRRVELDLIGELVKLPPMENLTTFKDDMYYIKLRNRLNKVLNRTFDLIREMENEINSLKAR